MGIVGQEATCNLSIKLGSLSLYLLTVWRPPHSHFALPRLTHHHSTDPGNFAPGAVASPAFDWWVVSMHMLGAPFDDGVKALSAWLDGPASSGAVDSAAAHVCSKGWRAGVAELALRLEACAADKGAVLAIVDEALGSHTPC
jgi:hypothetical protein